MNRRIFVAGLGSLVAVGMLGASRVTAQSTPVASLAANFGPIEILYWYTSWDEAPVVFGEMRNNSDRSIAFNDGMLVVSLYNEEDVLIETVRCRPLLADIAPRETLPFRGVASGQSGYIGRNGWAKQELSINLKEFEVSPYYRSLVASDVEASLANFNNMIVKGIVTNDADIPTGDYVAITAAGFDTDGRFVGALTWTISTSLGPGQSAKFMQELYASGYDGAFNGQKPQLGEVRIYLDTQWPN